MGSIRAQGVRRLSHAQMSPAVPLLAGLPICVPEGHNGPSHHEPPHVDVEGERATSDTEPEMHEKELVDAAFRTLVRLTKGKIPTAVEIALGPGVETHEAEVAWKELTDGTPYGSTHVTWERALDVLVCEEAGHRYTSDGVEACPYCGADGVVIEPAVPVSLGRWTVQAA
ncbi:MAG: hypothetical protein ACLFWM_04275 [Actinomycetota bacterium]